MCLELPYECYIRCAGETYKVTGTRKEGGEWLAIATFASGARMPEWDIKTRAYLAEEYNRCKYHHCSEEAGEAWRR